MAVISSWNGLDGSMGPEVVFRVKRWTRQTGPVPVGADEFLSHSFQSEIARNTARLPVFLVRSTKSFRDKVT